ncbi:unnamed protein product (macronuclear) [Paramecium tetraurelia]|uniref:Transmembrane protein n=1 Tax=Paramecium tetraurelia TaxID=5888 RepID=A0EDE6_PARTE|nr:uncharacterized protein GSPATT00004182001 [Paramecium tetraurelia]CAK93313.1 unnamed protein product [Paramecium tetraurelia]|eukprot:XP_001460710.1 hypothetical protein (macronuclear) [Paramecium tetraurelia strain d4-2]
MIKKFSLSFFSSELEYSFKKWVIEQNQFIYETTLATITIYLIINLINYNNDVIYIITTSTSLCIELTILFFYQKYPLHREFIQSLNLIIFAITIDIYMIYHQIQDTAIEMGIMKYMLYLQGNRFRWQTLIFLLGFGAEVSISQMDVVQQIAHGLFRMFIIFFRYQVEMRRRQYYLAQRSQLQYENLIEEQLPTWVVLIKYDKQQGQIRIDKINRIMRETFNIVTDQKFREFLRDSNIQPLEEPQKKQFNFEELLLKELVYKQETNQISKFLGYLINNEKKWQFQITKIYLNSIEPTILLLFIEQGGNLYEFYSHQIKWRDQQLVNQSKQFLNYIKDQIGILKFFKQQSRVQELFQISNQISNSYILFNQSLNIYNITQITYGKLKYKINEFQLIDLIYQLKEDLKFTNNQLKSNILMKTDRSKMISIILSISEFIKIMLAIITNDEKQLYECHPSGYPIQIRFKRIKHQPGCLKITMKHQNLKIPHQIQEALLKAASYTDHKKRNWGVNHYYENIQNLSEQIHNLNMKAQKVTKSQISLLDLDLASYQQAKEVNLKGSTEPFSTLGLPLAQYLVCQLGPNNQINFKDTQQQKMGDSLSFRNSTPQTKISFQIYEDLNEFIYQLNEKESNPYLDCYISNEIQQSTFKTFHSLSPSHQHQRGSLQSFINTKLN